MTKVLTDAAVRSLKPTPGARRVVRDGGARSLYLVIQPSGHKSWMMRFRRPGGKIAKIVLGPVDLSGKELTEAPKVRQPLSLPAARQLAAEVHRDRAMGRDVIADRRRQRGAPDAFGALVQAFVTDHVSKLRRPHETERTLRGIAERWRDRPVAEITADDIHAVIAESTARGIPGLERRNRGASDPRGRRVGRALSNLFSWAARHRWVKVDPCGGGHVPGPGKARQRVLTDPEIRSLWSACGEVHAAFGACVKLLLLTGSRLNEVAQMRWSELSEDGTVLRLPGERTKTGLPHDVPLAPVAREIIAQVRRFDGSALVLTTTGSTPISGWSKTKRKLDAAMGDPPAWVIHDLRRTAATGMAEVGVAPHVGEACLNHVSGAKAGVAGVAQSATR